uniref:Cep192-like domain-containing protein n=1 Tax=Hucho hucho TaxID=62062 RepID=A0A4W5K9U4_9TELE
IHISNLYYTYTFQKPIPNSRATVQSKQNLQHFTSVGKDYQRSLKIINISSEVIHIHIIPTQTKHFKTKYLKKHRLVPRLSYTVKVHFCPDEWRYFYNCIQVHCKGEENLQVPVHAYPIIDDLHIPTHITIPAVPLGQSVSHVIPLSCSCPIDFEFQVYIIQPHKAFSVQPLSGVISANGKVEVTVTFRPFQYETPQVTLQVVISQFNSKPYVCTLSVSSSPHLALSQQEKDMGHEREVLFVDSRGPPPVSLIQPLTKTKQRSMRTPKKSKLPGTGGHSFLSHVLQQSSGDQAESSEALPAGSPQVEEETFHPPKSSPDNVIPFTFLIFSLPNQSDELAPSALGAVPVRPVEVLVKRHTPFFNLKVPQHYKLMGYQPVSAFEAAASYIPPTQPRTLCTGAQLSQETHHQHCGKLTMNCCPG